MLLDIVTHMFHIEQKICPYHHRKTFVIEVIQCYRLRVTVYSLQIVWLVFSKHSVSVLKNFLKLLRLVHLDVYSFMVLYQIVAL